MPGPTGQRRHYSFGMREIARLIADRILSSDQHVQNVILSYSPALRRIQRLIATADDKSCATTTIMTLPLYNSLLIAESNARIWKFRSLVLPLNPSHVQQ